MTTELEPQPKASAAILQLHIELRNIEPKIWRRVLVPDTITLRRLHSVIQSAFGWNRSHLHEFIGGHGLPISKSGLLVTALSNGTVDYVYDHGDCWTHCIQIEERLAANPALVLPRCIDGACATPPEDCGGTWGYERVVQVMADPHDPDHKEMAQWLGVDTWDPLAFDIVKVNARLARVKV